MCSRAEPAGAAERDRNTRYTLLLATLSLAALGALVPIDASGPASAAVAPSCRVAAAHVPCPDLTLDQPSYRFTDNNGTLALSVVVHNSGDAPSQPTEVEASAAGWQDVRAPVDPLPPESVDKPGTGQVTVTSELPVPDAQRGAATVFTLRVNPDQTTPEGNTENNTTTIHVDVPPKPPASTSDLTFSKDGSGYSFPDRKTVQLSVVVVNIGGTSSAATNLTASAADWPERTIDLPALKPQQRKRTSLRLPIPAAQRGATSVFTLTIDPRHALKDSNPSNNAITLTVSVPRVAPPPRRRADLALRQPKHRFLNSGGTLLLSVTVVNLGGQAARQTKVVASAAGWKDVAAAVPALDQKAHARVWLRLHVPDAQRGAATTFTLRVNPELGVPESNPNNNTALLNVSVPAASTTSTNSSFPWWAIGLGTAAALVALAVAALGWSRRQRPRRLESRAGYDRGEPPSEASGPPPPAPPPPAAPPRADGGASAPPAPSDLPPSGEGAPPPVPERVVNTGFASVDDPDAGFARTTPLVCAQTYFFWLDIGEPVAESIEGHPTPLPPLPASAQLDVVVFGAGLTPIAGQESGRLLLTETGAAKVVRPAATPTQQTVLAETRLFFPVRAPAEPGRALLRCNIYFNRTLIQSRLVSADVRRSPVSDGGRLESELDYTLAPSLNASHLAGLPTHRLSVLLNQTGNGTHLLTFAGEGDFTSSAEIDELALQDMIEEARRAMRLAAWNKPDPWTTTDNYSYDGFDLPRLQGDLTRFALRGFRLYAAIADRLTGGFEQTERLNTLMQKPGLVQIAVKGTARRLLPAALFYDYFGLQTNRPRLEDYSLCSEFTQALSNAAPLEQTPCFQGACPARGTATTICPSGFWGYRHALGIPVSIAGAADVPTEIGYADAPSLTLAVSTDPDFVQRLTHEAAIRALVPSASLSYADSFEELLAALKAGRSDIVYFYCHGGIDRGIWPYLQVGPLNGPVLTADVLFSERIHWNTPRPLIFINGCHTVAVEPEKVVEFVTALVGSAQAAGVIGTEITVFEPLATVFGLECLQRFLAGAHIGDSVRGARLALLKQGNPLGLVYIPFALASLRLAHTGTGTPSPSAARPRP